MSDTLASGFQPPMLLRSYSPCRPGHLIAILRKHDGEVCGYDCFTEMCSFLHPKGFQG